MRRGGGGGGGRGKQGKGERIQSTNCGLLFFINKSKPSKLTAQPVPPTKHTEVLAA